MGEVVMEVDDMESNRRKWHLDKSFSISHLITTLMIAASVALWAMNMDKRVALLEMSVQNQNRVDEKQDRERQDLALQWRDELKGINAKLDRLIESKVRQ
ncbi:MAG: hypothetical protein ABIG70_02950 [Pseudomonadota bacterium]